MASEIDDYLESLTTTVGVLGVVVNDAATGNPIRDTFAEVDRTIAMRYGQIGTQLLRDAREIGTLDKYHGGGEEAGVAALRIRTKTVELFIKANSRYQIVVVQDPTMSMV